MTCAHEQNGAVLVLARYEDEVMEPLTRSDETRTWRGRFERIPDWFVGGWYLEFYRERQRRGVLADLEALPWNNPECVQVMLHTAPARPVARVSLRGCCCLILRGARAGHCRADGQAQIEAAVHVHLEPAVHLLIWTNFRARDRLNFKCTLIGTGSDACRLQATEAEHRDRGAGADQAALAGAVRS
ncbi:hypothetical protein [Streptomyces sp. NPDC005969]|uniref:hypothetical protein n=1 Tax=Streptomyces sp. NPDC005969 TaxID=3156722 RepID=UPI0033C67B7B